MKYANLVLFIDDLDAVAVIRPTHRQYLAGLIDEGQLVTTGPFHDGTGALFVYEVETLEQAEQLAADDPYAVGGVISQSTLKAWNVLYADSASWIEGPFPG